MRRTAPLDYSCPRLQAAAHLLTSQRGQVWVINALEGLSLPESLRLYVRGHIHLLLMRGVRVAHDISMPSFDERGPHALDSLTPEVWICTFCDTTSPITILVGLDHDVLNRGIGQIGYIPIPDFIWDFLAPGDFDVVGSTDLGGMCEMSEEAQIIARFLHRNGVVSH